MLYLLLNEYSKAFIIVAFTEQLRCKYFFLYFPVFPDESSLVCSVQKTCDMENCRGKKS